MTQEVHIRCDSMSLSQGLAAALLDSKGDAIVVCDRDGLICYWNAGAERIFGFAESEALGQSLDIIIPDRLRARHWAGYQDSINTGHSRYSDGDLLAVPALRKDQSQISIEFTIAPLKDADGKIWALAAVIRDVTARFEELKSLRRQLQAQRRSPEQS